MKPTIKPWIKVIASSVFLLLLGQSFLYGSQSEDFNLNTVTIWNKVKVDAQKSSLKFNSLTTVDRSQFCFCQGHK